MIYLFQSLSSLYDDAVFAGETVEEIMEEWNEKYLHDEITKDDVSYWFEVICGQDSE